MIFFGHLGITTGAIKAYEKFTYTDDRDLKNGVAIDYRFVLIGSILPDIIDKPIGAYLFRSTFHNSRIFAHTLLFAVTLILIGLYMLYKLGKNNILVIGICTSIHLNNGGGAWDNAKKYIELGNYGGKSSETHKAAVVGDTVGDPFKDTAGPSIHVLIKLFSTITLLLATLFVTHGLF